MARRKAWKQAANLGLAVAVVAVEQQKRRQISASPNTQGHGCMGCLAVLGGLFLLLSVLVGLVIHSDDQQRADQTAAAAQAQHQLAEKSRVLITARLPHIVLGGQTYTYKFTVRNSGLVRLPHLFFHLAGDLGVADGALSQCTAGGVPSGASDLGGGYSTEGEDSWDLGVLVVGRTCVVSVTTHPLISEQQHTMLLTATAYAQSDAVAPDQFEAPTVEVSSGHPSWTIAARADPTLSTLNDVGFGPTAMCADGSASYSQHRSGTCSHHGGVSVWGSGWSTTPHHSVKRK